MASANSLPDPVGQLWRATDAELADLYRERITVRNRLDAELGQLAAQVHARGTNYGYGSTLAWVQDIEHLAYGAAKKMLDRALALNPSHAVDGTEIPAIAPLTGAAAAAGALGAGQIDAIVSTMKQLPESSTDQERARAETILVDIAHTSAPREISQAGQRILDYLDPDGPEPKDPKTPRHRRELHFQEHRDGTATLNGLLDPVTYSALRTSLDPYAKPRPATPEEGRDTRSAAERTGDAFADFVQLALKSPDLPLHNGDRTQVVVTMPLDDLRTGLGAACLDLVGDITAAEARVLACDAGIIPMVLGTDSEPLDVGRMKRLVTPGQRRMLVARDCGCTFPICRRRAKHCDAHHILEWSLGGLTTLGNLTLLCGHHHRLIHSSEWEIRMGTDGKPDFIPPAFLDPLRKPRRNTVHDTTIPLAA